MVVYLLMVTVTFFFLGWFSSLMMLHGTSLYFDNLVVFGNVYDKLFVHLDLDLLPQYHGTLNV